MILEWIAIGFFTAFGWWGANHYVIEPHLESNVTVEAKK